jgi:CHAD domain-containing protein
MNDSRLQEHLRKHFKNCTKSLITILGGKYAEVQAVHDLRVEIKKVRAIASVVSSCDDSFHKARHMQPFRELFKSAGELRDLHRERALLKKHIRKDRHDDHLAGLDVLILQASENLHRVVERGMVDAITAESRKVVSHIDAMQDKIASYFNSEWQRTNRRVHKNIFKERELHVVRKNLKNFLYGIKGVSAKNNTPLKERLRVWERLLTLLGAWHDCQTAFDDLTRIFYGDSGKSDTVLKNIKLKLMIEKEKLFERILNAYRVERRAFSENPFVLIE